MDVIIQIITSIVGNLVYDILKHITKDPFHSLQGKNGSDTDDIDT